MSPSITPSGGGGGGSQPLISEAMVVALAIDTESGALDSSNSWTHSFTLGETTIQSHRGTDLTLVNHGGVAAVQTAAGGDFAMMATHSLAPTLDGGSALQRYVTPFINAPPVSDLSGWGLDAIIPAYAGAPDQRTAQPFFGVPAAGLVTDLLLGISCINAAGTDSIVPTCVVTIWKIGALA